MGCEYTIKAVLSEVDREAIQVLFETHPYFKRKINYGGKWRYEFQNMKTNPGPMPDVSFILEQESLYCCRHDCVPLWKSFEVVPAYFENNGILFQMEEL
jgi:hypothetical protein